MWQPCVCARTAIDVFICMSMRPSPRNANPLTRHHSWCWCPGIRHPSLSFLSHSLSIFLSRPSLRLSVICHIWWALYMCVCLFRIKRREVDKKNTTVGILQLVRANTTRMLIMIMIFNPCYLATWLLIVSFFSPLYLYRIIVILYFGHLVCKHIKRDVTHWRNSLVAPVL